MMSQTSTESQYYELKNQVENVKDHLTNTVGVLTESGYINDKQTSLTDALSNIIKDADFPKNDVIKYLLKVDKLMAAFEEFESNKNSLEYFEVSKQKYIGASERAEIWKLWRDKLGRWVLGASSAVVLYSAFVALSKSTEFIVIPVRDLILGG